MTDPILIERSELTSIARNPALMALREFNAQNITNPFVSQNHAVKMLGKGGRGKLERAMKKGKVRFHKRNPESRIGRVNVYYEDVLKLLNSPEV